MEEVCRDEEEVDEEEQAARDRIVGMLEALDAVEQGRQDMSADAEEKLEWLHRDIAGEN